MYQFITFLLTISCLNIPNLYSQSAQTPKQKEMEAQRKAATLRSKQLLNQPYHVEKIPNNNLTDKEAIKAAEKQFEAYLPKILDDHDAAIDVQEAFAGDFTGDGINDVLIYFSLSPRGGGNALVGQGLTLYKNSGNTVKVIAGYEPDYLFEFNKIENGKIHVTKLEYAATDGRCCPSIKTPHVLTIKGTKVY